MSTEPIVYWYKLTISFYQEGEFFAVKCWQDILNILDNHIGFDIVIQGQYTKLEDGLSKYKHQLYTNDNVEGIVYICSNNHE